ncbi:MAG: hypothetical protein C4320_00860 [Armatimonadota bacterium]
MFPAWTILIGFWLGAVAGSFLNVVIYRLPRGISLSNPPHSFCPKCEHRLGVKALIPLASWLFARGRCVYCKAPVWSRYFWVELVNASLWAILWKIYFVDAPGYDWITPVAYLLTTAALVAIVWIDGELFIIPDEICAFLLAVGLVYGAATGRFGEAVLGALTGWGVLFGIAFLGRVAFKKDAMGHGDIKMMRGIGALIGAKLVIFNLMIAVVLGLVGSLALMAFHALRQNKPIGEAEEDETPYEPESIRDLLVLMISYLLLFDVIALFWKGLYPRLGFEAEAENIEEDDWRPTATTLPFGPYLAAGALACLLFQSSILQFWSNYMAQFSGG